MAKNSKQYGLIMPQKANQGLIRPRPSIFNESSGSEEEGGGATDWVKKALKREAEKPFQKKQHQVDMEKALAEDSTVYQYDEVYDQLEEKKAEMITAKKQDKKPRYIQSLMMQAEKRKREQERRNERIIQKEREAEGDKFKDKESFVTSAYRAKLEEFRQQEEEERRMDTLEAIADVTKQKDLGGFYRHLYHQTMSGGAEEVKNKEDKDSENLEKGTESIQPDESKTDKLHEKGVKIETENVNPENAESSPQDSSKNKEDNPDKKHSRHYRKRNDSSASSDSDSKHSGENLDADSDFSVDSDSSDSDSKSGSNSEKENGHKKKQEKVKRKSDDQQDTDKNETSAAGDKTEKAEAQKNKEGSADNPSKKIKVEKESENGVTVPVENIVPETKVTKVKTNIWIKRTVGAVFESALQRYYERKANKLANRG